MSQLQDIWVHATVTSRFSGILADPIAADTQDTLFFFSSDLEAIANAIIRQSSQMPGHVLTSR